MNAEFAQTFVQRWLDAWNRHDLEAVLELFADEVTFTSPRAAQIVPESGGVVRGKSALREYWKGGLERNPNLRFELVGMYVGVNALTINFLHHPGALANEVLIFDGQLVVAGYGTYLSEEPTSTP